METSSSSDLDVLDSIVWHFPPVDRTGENGTGLDEIIYDCGHPCLHFVCKKVPPFTPLLNSLVKVSNLYC